MSYVILSFVLLFSPMTAQATQTELPTSLEIHDEEHFQFWVHALQTSPLHIFRKNAARHLGQLGDLRALPVLISALEDRDAEVRKEVSRSLGMLGSEEAIAPLFRIQRHDEDRSVSKVAERAIEKIHAFQAHQKSLEEKRKEYEKKKGSGSL